MKANKVLENVILETNKAKLKKLKLVWLQTLASIEDEEFMPEFCEYYDAFAAQWWMKPEKEKELAKLYTTGMYEWEFCQTINRKNALIKRGWSVFDEHEKQDEEDPDEILMCRRKLQK